MQETQLIIHIDFIYFAGTLITIVGTLLAISYRAGTKFSSIENELKWLKEGLNELKQEMRNGFSEMKAELRSFKTEVKEEIATVKTDAAQFQHETQKDLAWMKRDLEKSPRAGGSQTSHQAL